MQSPYFRTLIIAALCLAGLAQELSAQEADSAETAEPHLQLRIGVTGGFHSVHHTFGNRTINAPARPLFEPANSTGWFAGIVSEFRLDQDWGVGIDIRYNDLPGHSSTTYINPEGYSELIELIASATAPDHQDTAITYTSDVEYTSLSVGLLGKWRTAITDSVISIGISAGPVFHYITEHTIIHYEDLESPLNARFINPESRETELSGRRIIYYGGEIPGAITLRPGIQFGIDLQFEDPRSGLIISPGMFYDYGLDKVSSYEPWYAHTLSGRISLIKNI